MGPAFRRTLHHLVVSDVLAFGFNREKAQGAVISALFVGSFRGLYFCQFLPELLTTARFIRLGRKGEEPRHDHFIELCSVHGFSLTLSHVEPQPIAVEVSVLVTVDTDDPL